MKLGAVTVGEASDLEQALELVGVEQLDLMLLGWELPAQGGAAALAELQTVLPRTRSDRSQRQDALAAGADAFVSKGEPPERLMAEISTDFDGVKRYCNGIVTQAL